MRKIENYKGYKNKMKSKIDLNDKINKFIPGMYIIFLLRQFNWHTHEQVNHLILGNIIRKEDTKSYFDDGEYKIESYLVIKYIDFISDDESDINFDGDKYFNFENLGGLNNPFYLSASLKDTRIKFDELKTQSPYSEWIINMDSNKYNL